MRLRHGALILMITPDALSQTLARCRELKLDQVPRFGYLVKPIRLAGLANAITAALRDPWSAGTWATPEAVPSTTGEVMAAAPAANGGADHHLSPSDAHSSAASSAVPSGAATAARAAPAGRGLRVLIAEDSDDNRMLIEAYFKGTGYHLEAAANGAIAVELFKRKRYDLVLMDIHMPVMDGHTAVRQIRKWEQENNRPPTPIIALTASALDEAVRESLEVGCDAHLSKPIRRATLLEAIRGMTQDRAGTREGGPDHDVTAETDKKSPFNVVQIDTDLSDLIPGFLAHKREDARTIGQAIERGDYTTVSQIGHKMKGEGGSYGLDAITTMGAAIEQAGNFMDAAAARRWADELVTFLDTVEIVYA